MQILYLDIVVTHAHTCIHTHECTHTHTHTHAQAHTHTHRRNPVLICILSHWDERVSIEFTVYDLFKFVFCGVLLLTILFHVFYPWCNAWGICCHVCCTHAQWCLDRMLCGIELVVDWIVVPCFVSIVSRTSCSTPLPRVDSNDITSVAQFSVYYVRNKPPWWVRLLGVWNCLTRRLNAL